MKFLPLIHSLRVVGALIAVLAAWLPLKAQEPVEEGDTLGATLDIPDVSAYSFNAMNRTPQIGLDSLKNLYGELPAAVAFAALPDSIIPLLSQHTRLDMIDYAKEGIMKDLRNEMKGMSALDTLSARYLRVNITPVSNLQLGIYKPGKGKPITVASYTISPRDAAADSQLLFYNADMIPIAVGKVIKIPGIKDFLRIPRGAEVTADELASEFPFTTIEYRLQPLQGTLTATITTDAAMALESLTLIKPYLQRTLTYRWTGKKFELEKAK